MSLRKPEVNDIKHCRNLKVLIALGGTGGHIYPALALAEHIRRYEYLFVTLELERRRKLINQFPYTLKFIDGTPLSLRYLFSFWRNFRGFQQARKVIAEFKPDIIIATGSYACVLPALAGWSEGIPLILMEQNSVPGRAIRFLAHFATKIILAFPKSAEMFPESIREKTVIAGNPVRSGFWRIRDITPWEINPIPTILLFAGSQGAVTLNMLARELIGKLPEHVQLIWITGTKLYADTVSELQPQHNVTVLPYHERIWELMRTAWLVIGRAGASTIWELGISARPSILIPYPHAKDNHQYINAEFLAEIGGTVIRTEPLNLSELVSEILELLLKRRHNLEEMRENLLKCEYFQVNPLNSIAKLLEDIGRER